MKRWVLVGVTLLAVLAAWLLWPKPAAKPPQGAKQAAKVVAKRGQPAGAPLRSPFAMEADPEGTLRLEGVVVDAAGLPVANAEVALSSSPPRKATTEDDGSFAFDRLLGRTYFLSARAGDSVGTANHILNDTSAPVTITLRAGATLHVTVTSEQGPVAGAAVKIAGMLEQAGQTDASGKVSLRGLGLGMVALSVRADGFAPHSETVMVTESSKEVAVRLRTGVAVSGRVVDEANAPVSGASVFAEDASAMFAGFDAEPLATSGDDGSFAIPVLAAGSYRLVARHSDYAAGTSAVTVEQRPVTDVVVRMVKGLTVRGRVVTTAKGAVPYAQVNYRPSGRGGGGGAIIMIDARTATAGADGTFTFSGLPEGEARFVAESLEASSSALVVELARDKAPGGVLEGLELVLDQTATISGTTVDAAGQPVGEVAVSAWLSPTKNELEPDEMFGGGAQATSDADGNFVVRGLRDGTYTLSANSGGEEAGWGSGGPSVDASAGATGVKVRVAGRGKLVGKVAFADGTPVRSGRVIVTWSKAASIVDGGFSIDDVAEGDYSLRITGPDFADASPPTTKVEAGKTTDLGTIQVERGRKLTGIVVDGKGRAVAGAKVYVGEFLMASGKGMAAADAFAELGGLKSIATGDDGRFVITGIARDEMQVLAEKEGQGRSRGTQIAAGVADASVELQLVPYGAVEGKVTMGGKPAGVQIIAAPDGNISASTMVTSGADGSYVLERLPAGAYRVTFQQMGMMGASSVNHSVTVKPNARVRLDVDIPVGDVTLTVEVAGKAGATVNAAQIFLFKGPVAATNGGELLKLFSNTSGAAMQFWLGTTAPSFKSVIPGAYSVCTVPITGNILDQAFMQKLNQHSDKLAVYCASYTVTATPKAQAFRHEVPAMAPLPE